MLAKYATWDASKVLFRLDRLAKLDPAPILRDLGKIINEDNRAGVLSGLDKDGRPMIPVGYRSGHATPTRFRHPSTGRFGTMA